MNVKIKSANLDQKLLDTNDETIINIFSDDFSSGHLSKWTSISPYDTTQVVEYDGSNALCVAGMGNVTYLHNYTDGHYNLNTDAFLNMTFHFLMENKDSKPNIFLAGPHGGRSFTITCEEYNLEPNVWYELSVSTYCPPNADPDINYITKLMGNANLGSTDKTYFKNISINQTYLLDTTFEGDTWENLFIKNDNFNYTMHDGVLAINADSLPKQSETPAVLLKPRKEFTLLPYTVSAMMRCYVRLSGAGVIADSGGVYFTNSLTSETLDLKTSKTLTDISDFQASFTLTIIPKTYISSMSVNNPNESNSGGELKIKSIVIGNEYLNINKI